MDDVVVLEWTYSPPGFVEGGLRVDRSDYVMVANGGKVEARIDPRVYDEDPGMRDELHDALNDRFLGIQLVTHSPYQLSGASMYRLHADRRRDVTIFPKDIASTTAIGSPDIVITDKDGNVFSDSRKDRTEKTQALTELVARYRSRDKTAASILNSYAASIRDPNNELVHLYEIRDALSSKFGGEKATRAKLAISGSDWSDLGNLANNAPVRQGRHRGKKVGELRDAAEAELKSARRIALAMIEAHFEYLEAAGTAAP